jgi:hypothetical protein
VAAICGRQRGCIKREKASPDCEAGGFEKSPSSQHSVSIVVLCSSK